MPAPRAGSHVPSISPCPPAAETQPGGTEGARPGGRGSGLVTTLGGHSKAQAEQAGRPQEISTFPRVDWPQFSFLKR